MRSHTRFAARHSICRQIFSIKTRRRNGEGAVLAAEAVLHGSKSAHLKRPFPERQGNREHHPVVVDVDVFVDLSHRSAHVHGSALINGIWRFCRGVHFRRPCSPAVAANVRMLTCSQDLEGAGGTSCVNSVSTVISIRVLVKGQRPQSWSAATKKVGQ